MAAEIAAASQLKGCRVMRVLLVAMLVVLSSPPAHADNPPVRAGLPCLRQVCVGDDLPRVLSIPWEPVTLAAGPASSSANQGSSSPLERLRTILRADEATLERIAPYWSHRMFDATGLDALGQVRAVCHDLGVWMRPQATYVNDHGHTTIVTFEPVPSIDSQTQRFRVATVTRIYPEDTSEDELARIGREIAVKYGELPMYASETQPGVQWLPEAREGPTLRLFGPIGDSADRAILLSRHPSCQWR
jgi:hypothetical protein